MKASINSRTFTFVADLYTGYLFLTDLLNSVLAGDHMQVSEV